MMPDRDASATSGLGFHGAHPIRTAFARNVRCSTAVAHCADTLQDRAPTLLIAFAGGKHDPDEVLAALRREFAPAPIVGGSAAGVIARHGCGYSGLEIGIVAFYDPAVTPAVVVSDGLVGSEHAVGQALGEQVRPLAEEDSLVLMFYGSVASQTPLLLHPASTIVEGFQRGIGNARVHLVGAGMLTDFNLGDGWVFDGTAVRRHATVALVFPPGIAAETAILHGCRPVSSFMEITQVEGAVVYQIDHQPALAVIERALGIPVGSARGPDLSLVATLGQKYGDRFAPYDERAYVNRLILSANPENGSITLFEQDFAVGAQVQIMSRDNALMLDSVRRGVAEVNQAVVGRESVLALYVDCAGRASARSGSGTEEADLVAAGLRAGLPFMGFYSGVEIAPVGGGHSRPLDWTGVLTVLHRR